MKKLMFIAVLGIMACTFVSCGNCTSSNSTCDSDSVVLDSLDTITVVDSAVVDSINE